MVHIINHIRVFARESGKPQLRPVRINDVIKSSMDMLGTQFKTRGIILEYDLGDDLPVIYANPFSLEEVFINLLINARDALEKKMELSTSSESVKILLHTWVEELDSKGYVNIEMADNGTGIPEDILERVFDPFFSTKGPDKGTGLGLSISKSIVEGFGGTIYISSTIGLGTTVNISLPVSRTNSQNEQ